MPVLVPQYELRIGGRRVALVKKIRIVSSWTRPCDTAEIEFPMLRVLTLSTFAENQDVEVRLGNTDLGLETVFTGTISEVAPDLPLKLKCEDHFKAAREVRYTETYREKRYFEIAEDAIRRAGLDPVISQEEESSPEKNETYRVDHHTVAEVLEKLRDRGKAAFVIPGTKQCYYGPPWPYARGLLQQPHKPIFRFGLNVISADSLEYKPRPKYKGVVVHMVDREFHKHAVTGSYPSGAAASADGAVKVMTLDESFSDNETKAKEKANKRAQEEYFKLTASSGYQGSFKTFGNPRIRHSYEIRIEDPHHSERNGNFWVDQVIHEFSMDAGFKADIEVCAPISGGSA